jgi:hypothetical protein
MNYDEIDRYTRDLRYGPVVNIRDTPKAKDKAEQDFRMIISLLDDMLYSYAHKYQDKKDKMISNMIDISKQMSDLNIKRLMAHCTIFPKILNEFNAVLSNELEDRKQK